MVWPNWYDINDGVVCDVTFKNAAGALTDPTTVTFKLENPAGTETIYVYGTHGQLVKDATGVYHVDVTPTTSGRWTFRFEGTGTVIAAFEKQFLVKRSVF